MIKTIKILIKKWDESVGPMCDKKKYEVWWCMRNLSKDVSAELKSLLQGEVAKLPASSHHRALVATAMGMILAVKIVAATAKVTARVCHRKGKLRLGSWRQVILYIDVPNALEILRYKADSLTFIVMAYLDFFQVSNVHRLHCKLIYLPTLKFVLVNLWGL